MGCSPPPSETAAQGNRGWSLVRAGVVITPTEGRVRVSVCLPARRPSRPPGYNLKRDNKVVCFMGDKNPKSQAKSKKQADTQRSASQAAHDKKQAAPAPAAPGGKGKK